MVDTINLRLCNDNYENSYLTFARNTLERVKITEYENGCISVAGKIGNLNVFITKYSIEINGGSLCKWYLGDNLQTLYRRDIKNAIEKLSDTLHLNIGNADITRLDIAQNILLNYPIRLYLKYFGLYAHKLPLTQNLGIYYEHGNETLCFYDKIEEMKRSGAIIPTIFTNENIMRYEQRYFGRIPQTFELPNFTADMLYKEKYYIKVLDKWRAAYEAIDKIKDIGSININFENMKTKKDLYKIAVAALIKNLGGKNEVINQINIAAKNEQLTRKQKFDLLEVIEDCANSSEITFVADFTTELDKKIAEAISYYR